MISSELQIGSVGRATVTDGGGTVSDNVVVVLGPTAPNWDWRWYAPELQGRWFRDEHLSNFQLMKLVEDK